VQYNNTMSDKQTTPENEPKGGDDMLNAALVRKTLFVDPDTWQQALRKAKNSGLSLALVVRQLLKAYVNGDVKITINGEDKN
jgi:hypothetical protein